MMATLMNGEKIMTDREFIEKLELLRDTFAIIEQDIIKIGEQCEEKLLERLPKAA
jgi:hypothetical protein